MTKFNVLEQFNQKGEQRAEVARNLNAAFLIVLCGKSTPLYSRAKRYMQDRKEHPYWKEMVVFFQEALPLIHLEISDRCYHNEEFENSLNEAHEWLKNFENHDNREETIEKIWKIFFPEAAGIRGNESERIRELREKREVRITDLNPEPINNPAKEMLFTSNILVTTPSVNTNIDSLEQSERIKSSLKETLSETQKFWYDHPIQIGVETEKNEAVYGIKGLNEAVAFEKERGTVEKGAKVNLLLSVSVTHEGLEDIVKEYLEEELSKVKDIDILNLFVFTESDTIKIIEEILIPASDKYLDGKSKYLFYEIFGVDGEYGRHYTFLKAIAALWHVLIDNEVKATFKIDLDQIFPQKELVQETGLSALEHFKTPNWGAKGIDSSGQSVEMGLIAGALVNKNDIKKGIFTPDVTFSKKEVKGSQLLFFSSLPQALSTQAEMMTRYNKEEKIDGKNYILQRIHVTGGTNGILIKSLRKYRPFAPIFIGRAEDQVYILSTLNNKHKNNLVYLHKDGLIMRHDKQAFAQEAIQTANLGKIIGDYTRILLFSYYARSLPVSSSNIKEKIDPFTGSFISSIPLTVTTLRMTLEAMTFFDEKAKEKEGYDFLQMGIKRIYSTYKEVTQQKKSISKKYLREKDGWNIYYEILDHLEKNIKEDEEFSLSIQKKARDIITKKKIKL